MACRHEDFHCPARRRAEKCRMSAETGLDLSSLWIWAHGFCRSRVMDYPRRAADMLRPSGSADTLQITDRKQGQS